MCISGGRAEKQEAPRSLTHKILLLKLKPTKAATEMRDFVVLTLISALAAVLVLVTVPVSVVNCVSLPLERVFPLTHGVELDQLRARDRLRHARFLQGSVGGFVDFSVQGSSNVYLGGLYFTKVKLGSPPREFNVQIDSGSDILWVSCNSCSDCPQSSGLGIQLNFFNAASSSTARPVPCSDPMCTSGTAATECSTQSNQCSYTLKYVDGSGTSGYYVSDVLYFEVNLGQSLIANSSAPIVFGCSTYRSGGLSETNIALDGLFGFGPGELSVISQLSSRGITPKVFSHCLKGDDNGGGQLVLGEILEPGIVYSPLVPSKRHYNLDLQSIAVNGKLLQIDPAAFATSNNRGTIVDSGTTLVYFVAEAYDPLVNSITAIVQQSVTPTMSSENQCYLVSGSVTEIFPPISLNFAGGASMVLKPEEYLVHDDFSGPATMWCIAFHKAQEGVTFLGDLFLKDKIIVYDLARQQIGWANYDCSLSLNVSVTSGKDEYVPGQLIVSSSSRDTLFEMIRTGIMSLLMHFLVLNQFQFL